MATERIAIYVFKLMGVYSLIIAVKVFAYTIYGSAILSKSNPFALLLFLLNLTPFILVMIISYMLLSRTSLVMQATSLVRKVNDDFQNPDLIHIAVSIAGLVVIIHGLFQIFPIANGIQTYMELTDPVNGDSMPDFLLGIKHQVATVVTKIGLGSLLFFRPDLPAKLRLRRPSSDRDVHAR